jgi:hypothetical protein
MLSSSPSYGCAGVLVRASLGQHEAAHFGCRRYPLALADITERALRW